MIFRQLIDDATSTFTYLLACPQTRQAVLVDTVFEQHLRDLALVRELSLKLCATLDTHIHADHATGAWLMKQALGSDIVMPNESGVHGADRQLHDGDTVQFGSHRLSVRATPGHTASCVTFVAADESLALTGDALLIRGAGRTDFQQGDAHALFRSVRQRVLSLPDACRLYPGHDYCGRTMTTVAEEREHNPRLGDHVREEDFVGYMNNLGLPHPKRMELAVPANLACGRPGDQDKVPSLPDWGPVIRTYAGVYQIECEWAHRNADALSFIDVREHEEVAASPMGLVPGSLVVPLSQLRARLDTLATDRPIVAVCPAGARSAIAATVLEKAGVSRVANMRGGLLQWRALGLPVQR